MCPELNLFYHEEVIALSGLVCSVNETSGEIHTPMIMEAWDGVRRSICFGPSGRFKNRPYLLSARLHFLVVSHLNSIRYHFFLMLTYPSVFWDAPEKISNHDWGRFIVYYVGVLGEGAI